jgi:hypothetical protein
MHFKGDFDGNDMVLLTSFLFPLIEIQAYIQGIVGIFKC